MKNDALLYDVYFVCCMFMLTLSRAGTDTSFSLLTCPIQVEHGPLECIFDRPEKDSATWEDSLGMCLCQL